MFTYAQCLYDSRTGINPVTLFAGLTLNLNPTLINEVGNRPSLLSESSNGLKLFCRDEFK